MGNPDSGELELLDQLAEEFAARFRRGERPSIKEYTDKYPHLAAPIRDIFPAMVKIEQAEKDRHAPAEPPISGPAPPLQQVGDYRILREIGQGGMGVVYEAEQLSLGRHVALKVLPLRAAKDGTALERFRREARAAAKLHHTNIVPVFEVGRDENVCYYAMQFIQGQGLDQVVDELRRLRAVSGGMSPTAPLPPPPSDTTGWPDLSEAAQALLTGIFTPRNLYAPTPEKPPAAAPPSGTRALVAEVPAPEVSTVRPAGSASPVVLPGQTELSAVGSHARHFFRSVAGIGQQVATALAYAHARGIIHRDIKPSNLLLDAAGVVWITDFGLALTEDEGLTSTGDVVGTLRYLAPERFAGECDARADVYGLGLTLYELLVLRPAFDSSNQLQLMDQVRKQEPARPRALDPRIPGDLETIVLKAIDKDPHRRYPSAEDIAEDLRRFRASEPIRARRVGRLERVWRWCRRNPGNAGLLAALAAVVVVGFGLVTWKWRETEHQRRDLADARRHALAENRAARTARDREAGQRKRAENALYFSRIALAASAWQANDVRAAEQLLQQCRPEKGRPDRRGWEWYYLRGLCHAELQRFSGHRLNDISSLAFSPDGRLLASAAWSFEGPGETLVWDAATGALLRRLAGWQDSGRVAFTPRGRRLVVLTDRGRPWKAWDTRTWQPAPLVAPDRLGGNPDLPFRASANWDTLKIQDTRNGRKRTVRGAHEGEIKAVATSPDGEWIATGGDDQAVRLWEAPSARPGAVFRGHTHSVTALAFSPDATRLASADLEGAIKVWDLTGDARGRKLLLVNPHRPHPDGWSEWLANFSFTPDSRRVMGISLLSPQALLNTRDVTNGRLVAQRALPSLVTLTLGYRHATVFSPVDNRVASPRRGEPTALSICDGRTGKEIRVLRGHRGPIFVAAFSPDGRRIATASHNPSELKVWDAASGRVLLSRTHLEVTPAAWYRELRRGFEHDLRRQPQAAALLHNLFAWYLVTHPSLQSSHARQAVALARRAVVLGPANGACWNTLGVALYRAGDWEGARRALVKSRRLDRGGSIPNALFLALVKWRQGRRARARREYARAVAWLRRQPKPDPELRVFQAEAARLLGIAGHVPKGQKEPDRGFPLPIVQALAFSPDGRRLATGHHFGAGVRIWEVAGGKVLQTAWERTTVPVAYLAFSPKGGRLAAVDPFMRKSIRVLNLDTGRTLFTAAGPPSAETVAFSPDGKRLAAAGRRGQVPLWDAATGQEILTLHRLGSAPRGNYGFVARVVFSPDGRRIAANDWMGRVCVWEAAGPTAPSRRARFRAARERSFAWHLQRAGQSTSPAAADLHLRYAYAQEPPNLVLRWKRGTLAARRPGWFDRALADLNRVRRARPTDPYPLLDCAILLARHGRRLPASAFARVTDLGFPVTEAGVAFALLSLQAGYRRGYLQMCDKMLGEVQHHNHPVVASLTARTCLLLPGGVGDKDLAGRLATRSVTGTEDNPLYPEFCLFKGLAEYRAGHGSSAIVWLGKCLCHPRPPERENLASLHFILAMAYQLSGQPADARAALARGKELVERHHATPGESRVNGINRWIICRYLLREAEQKVKAKATRSAE
jgi:serine/threonine protein kinase/WD40 repeat protein